MIKSKKYQQMGVSINVDIPKCVVYRGKKKNIYIYINGWSGGTPISGKPKYIELVAWLRQSRARDLRNSPHPTEDLHLSVHVPSPSGKLTVHWKKYRHFWREKSTWLVVSTPLKNISQLGWLFPIYGKIEKWQPNHQPDFYVPWLQ